MSQPRSVGDDLPLDEELAQSAGDFSSTWKEATARWGHSLHSLAPYVGGFPPELAHYFIRKYSEVGDTVLDPFMGGGTTPLEAALHNRKALASDKFAYATCLAQSKCNPIPDEEFYDYLDARLEDAKKLDAGVEEMLDDENLKIFFSDYTLRQILSLREVLRPRHTSQAVYLQGLVCGILHGPNDRFLSLQTKDTYSGTPNYVKKYADRNDLVKPERDLRPRIVWNHELATDDYVPPWLSSQNTIKQADSRDLPFESNTADLVITSPPYLRKLDYTWNNWIRLWWLGADRKTEQSELDMTADISRYRQFMRSSLQEMWRVLSDDSVAVLVVGDVIKNLANKNQLVNIASLIREEAEEYTGFTYHNTVVDDYGLEGRSYVTANQTKYDHDDETRDQLATVDRCLILKKGDPNMSRQPSIDWSTELYK